MHQKSDKILGEIGQEIQLRIINELAPESLDVFDDSDRHIGHAGHRPEGETHFRIVISCRKLGEYSRVQKHQYIYKILDDLLQNRIHALQIEFK